MEVFDLGFVCWRRGYGKFDLGAMCGVGVANLTQELCVGLVWKKLTKFDMIIIRIERS